MGISLDGTHHDGWVCAHITLTSCYFSVVLVGILWVSTGRHFLSCMGARTDWYEWLVEAGRKQCVVEKKVHRGDEA